MSKYLWSLKRNMIIKSASTTDAATARRLFKPISIKIHNFGSKLIMAHLTDELNDFVAGLSAVAQTGNLAKSILLRWGVMP
jgi:hypothetical protein